MSDQLAEGPPKATKLFPLFYKTGPSDARSDASPTVEPRGQRKAQSKAASSISSENIREPKKAKKSSKQQPLRKADSDVKLTAVFRRKPTRSPAPMPLSPTSLNRPLTLGDTTEDEVESLSAPTSEDVVPVTSSPASSSLPDLDAGVAGSSHAPSSPISISSVDDSVISIVAPLPRRARKARQPTPIIIEEDGSNFTVIPSGSSKPLARTETMSSVGSRDQPIEIEDSPAKLKPSHPFFAPRPAVPNSPTRGPKLPPEWPRGDTQHIRGDQMHIRRSLSTACLAHSTNKTTVLDAAPVEWLNSASASTEPVSTASMHSGIGPSPLWSDPSAIAASHSSHPAFHAHYDPSPSGTWNERYRPTAAEHVLGNERHARYLRSWLKALRLHMDSAPDGPPTKARIHQVSMKRSAVIRAVNPKRKRRRASNNSNVDEWIVSEGDDEEEFDSDGEMGRSDDDFQPVLRDASADTPYPDGDVNFAKLSNVILLSGPPGVGKSAAAHACAMELDWSVFEIYPGIGKRSGLSILSLVGEAARNHLLHRGKTRDDIVLSDTGTTAERVPLGTSSTERLNHAAEARTVRQSLFLFDEVDNLFREDANFWPTLVQLIADSRRPVILTCNDTSLVPLEDLPIQAILEFKPCEPELATSYLQHLAQLNGLHLDRGVAHSIYARDDNGPARQDCSRGDLRQSINILQFWTSLAAASSSREPVAADTVATDWSQASGAAVNTPSQRHQSVHEDARDLHDLWRLTDVASQFDSRRECLIASIEQTGQPQQEDDVVGRVQLPASDAMDHLVGSGFLDRFDSIKAAALWASRHEFESTGAGIRARGSASPSSVRMDWKTRSADQRWHQMQQAAFLEDIVSSSALTVSRRELVLDYAPRVMEMVRCDDVFEADQNGGAVRAEGRGRRTRGQRKEQYERYVTLGPSAMAAVRSLGWHVD